MELQDTLLPLYFWVSLATGSLSSVCPGGAIKMPLVLIFLCVVVALIIRHASSGSCVSHSWVLLFPQDKVDAGLPTAIVSTLTIFKDCIFSFYANLLKQYL